VAESRQVPSPPAAEPHRRYRAALMLLLLAVVSGLLATFATVAQPTAVAAEPPPTLPPRPLRVATYNIHHGVGVDGLLDLERIAREVEETGAEVIGLQEVDRHWSERSDFVDQATWLADRLGLHMVYAANLDLDPLTPGAERRQYGTAILSRHRILSSTNTLLPRPEGGEQRGLLEAVIRVRGFDVRVFNTHLQHNSQVERLAQIARIREIVATANQSVVLLGDFNARPESPEISAITEDLVDAWVTAGVGPGYTIDAETPHARIDYVLTSEGIVARTAAVLSTNGSDHLPVVADLALPGGRPPRA
jgi:endonuclease/exonuclease/phosphatase family metal-dependent hydrolase